MQFNHVRLAAEVNKIRAEIRAEKETPTRAAYMAQFSAGFRAAVGRGRPYVSTDQLNFETIYHEEF